MLVNENVIRVRYQETDQMGVVYHSNYLIWLETGRAELMRKIGLPYSELEEGGVKIVVVKAYLEYKKPARYDDLITIVTKLSSLEGPRVTFDYEVKNKDLLLAKGYTEHVFVNEQGRPALPKKTNPLLWQRLLSALEAKSTP